MQQFIPFEDDWDAFESLCAGSLVPYRVGVICAHEPAAAITQRTGSISPSMFSAAPVRVLVCVAMPAGSPST